MPKFTLPLKNIASEDRAEVLPSLANLSFLGQHRVSLPKGFILTTQAFQTIKDKLLPSLVNLNLSETNLDQHNITTLLRNHLDLPDAAKAEVNASLSKLKFPLRLLAFSQKGKQDHKTFETLIDSKKEVGPALKNALRSAFSDTMLPQLSAESLKDLELAILFEEKLDPDISGKVLVSSKVVKIYSQWGEFFESASSDLAIFSGAATEPESYNVALQEKQVVYRNGKHKAIPVGKKYQFVNKLSPEILEALLKIARHVRSNLLVDFSFKFAVTDSEIFINELEVNESLEKIYTAERFALNLPVYRDLKPIFPGIASGIARYISHNKEIKKIRRGDIAILKNFEKKVLPDLKKGSGIILSQAGELTKENLMHLKKLGKATVSGEVDRLTNKIVTIDGKSGKVYLGAFPPPYIKAFVPNPNLELAVKVKSATKLFLKPKKLADFEAVSEDEFSGVGPVEGQDFFPKRNLLTDPQTLREKNESLLKLETFLANIGSSYPDKPLIYSPVSLTKAESEHNFHLFKEEASTISALRNQKYFKNLWLTLPYIDGLEQFKQIKEILGNLGLTKSPTFKLLLTVNFPAAALQIEDYIAAGVDGAIFDYYDLACLTYGKELTSAEIASVDGAALLPLLGTGVNSLRLEGLFSAIDNLPLENQKLVNQVIYQGFKAIICSAPYLTQSGQKASQAEEQLIKSKADK